MARRRIERVSQGAIVAEPGGGLGRLPSADRPRPVARQRVIEDAQGGRDEGAVESADGVSNDGESYPEQTSPPTQQLAPQSDPVKHDSFLGLAHVGPTGASRAGDGC
jgi:hypothetical protein